MADLKDNTEQVTAYIQRLEPEFAALVNAIRLAVLQTDKDIAEHIKWNSPAFYYIGEMKPFDPKEYKRDIVVINVRKNEALLVFPTGAVIKDKTGLLEGNYKDGRRMIKFKTLAEFEARKKDLQLVIEDWLKKVEK